MAGQSLIYNFILFLSTWTTLLYGYGIHYTPSMKFRQAFSNSCFKKDPLIFVLTSFLFLKELLIWTYWFFGFFNFFVPIISTKNLKLTWFKTRFQFHLHYTQLNLQKCVISLFNWCTHSKIENMYYLLFIIYYVQH